MKLGENIARNRIKDNKWKSLKIIKNLEVDGIKIKINHYINEHKQIKQNVKNSLGFYNTFYYDSIIEY